MCNLSWTPYSNLEKDNSLKTTPVLAQIWAVWSILTKKANVSVSFHPLGGHSKWLPHVNRRRAPGVIWLNHWLMVQWLRHVMMRVTTLVDQDSRNFTCSTWQLWISEELYGLDS